MNPGHIQALFADHADPSALVGLIQLRGSEADSLRRAAAAARADAFGDQVFIRAVIEISNFCRENCVYCGMRRDNRSLNRYRLELDALRYLCFEALPPSVTDINLQAGEDPVAVREIALPLIRELRAKTNYGISVCLGTLDPKLCDELRDAGAFYYIIKLETGDPTHYREMRSPGTYAERIEAIRYLASTGWRVSSGFILGLPGQDNSMVAETLRVMAGLPLAGVSVSPFIPGDETPLADGRTPCLDDVLNTVALMRLNNPERVIPAVSAMNILGTDGYMRALRSGANLATINMTPAEARDDYLLYKRDRFIMHEQRVLGVIEQAGLRPSPTSLASYFIDVPAA